ncbi:MAG: hypothetical protein WA366_04645 [Pseudolabrys sp.]
MSTTALNRAGADAAALMELADYSGICARRSGEALMSVQRSPSPEMARLASVRVRTRFSPAPAIWHTLQLQFLPNATTRRAPSRMPARPIEFET